MDLKRALLVLATGLFIAGCGQSEAPAQDSAAAPTPGVSDSEIVLGTHTDLSGPVAIWGVGSINGLRMRFDEANEAGGVHGRQIRFVVEDTQYQIPRAISAGNKLIHRDKIFAMVLAAGTPTNNAVMEEQFRNGVPNLFPLTGARSMVEPFHRLKFSQRGIYYDEMRAAVSHFTKNEGKTTPCVVYQDTDYGLEVLDGARDGAEALGLGIAATSAHKTTETEFTAAVLRLRDASCDLVLMGTIHRDTILILEAARKLGWEGVAFVGNNAAYAEVIAQHNTGATEGYYAFVAFTQVYEDDELTPEVRAWYDRYVERYDRAPDVSAMEGYRGADLIITAMEKVGRDLTRDKLIDALESINDYTDIWGNRVVFGPDDHHGAESTTLTVVRDGRWRVLSTLGG